jgi:hypothetical protein
MARSLFNREEGAGLRHRDLRSASIADRATFNSRGAIAGFTHVIVHGVGRDCRRRSHQGGSRVRDRRAATGIA